MFLTSSGGPLPIFRNSCFRPFLESWEPEELLAPFPLSFPLLGPPPRVACPGPPAPAPGRLPFTACLCSGPPGPGPGVGGGPVSARKLESFVLAPRPGRRGEEEGRGGCAPEALSGLGPGSGLCRGPRFLPAFPGSSSLGSLRRAKRILSPHESERLARHPCLSFGPCHLGRGRKRPALQLGPRPTLRSSRSFCFLWLKWGQGC